MSRKSTGDLWWRNAIVYCADVETFLDSDGDGVGDLPGMTERIDHLAGIGVTCLWLMPFHPSRHRDDGYDVTDHYAVDPRLGTLGDLAELVRTAGDRGIRVIADLVVNHTSTDHFWFQSARSSPDSPYRDFYVWTEEEPKQSPDDVVFPDREDSNWTYDEMAGAWYLHRFYHHQADLNVANPAVRDEIAQIAGFWLQQGLAGFRVDAVPFLIEPMGLPEGAIEDPHELLRDLRAYLGRRRGDVILLGEVNLPPADQEPFFGGEGRRQLDLVFDFLTMQRMYLALAREDARPLADALAHRPEPPDGCQWACFARNHDELTLDQLSEAEREEVFAAFGPEPDMQIFGRGLRRRLPDMLGRDGRRIRLVYSLVLTLPGTPVLFYGEEIGMGENLEIPGRMAVRSPMQWSADAQGGFSTARAGRLVRPLPDGPAAPGNVNVRAQRGDDASLLNWFERHIRRRRETPELGFGRPAVLPSLDPSVLTHRVDWAEETVVLLHNLAGRRTEAEVELADDTVTGLVDLLGDEEVPVGPGGTRIALEPYGYRWFRARRRGRRLPL